MRGDADLNGRVAPANSAEFGLANYLASKASTQHPDAHE